VALRDAEADLVGVALPGEDRVALLEYEEEADGVAEEVAVDDDVLVPLDVALEVALEVADVVAELDPLAVGLEDCEGEADDVRLAWAERVDELDRDAVRELELEPVDAALRELDALDEPDNEP
jgi:hypothetical protein